MAFFSVAASALSFGDLASDPSLAGVGFGNRGDPVDVEPVESGGASAAADLPVESGGGATPTDLPVVIKVEEPEPVRTAQPQTPCTQRTLKAPRRVVRIKQEPMRTQPLRKAKTHKQGFYAEANLMALAVLGSGSKKDPFVVF